MSDDDDDRFFLNKELFRRLCSELRDLLNQPSEDKDAPSDPYALQKYLFEYSQQKFAKRFNFKYEDKHSKPPNSKPGGQVLGLEAESIQEDFPATKEAVEHWMDTILFERTDRRFPPWAAGDIYDGTRDHVLVYTGLEGNPYPNEWNTAGFQKVYKNPTPNKTDIQEFSHFLHIRCDLTLDLPNGGKGRIQKTFVYYLAVFSTFESEW